MATFYSFDGETYADTSYGQHALLDAINDALVAEAYSDSDNLTPEQADEAVSMSYDGTNVINMTFWENIVAVMQQAPYQIDVTRFEDTDEGLTEEQREGAEFALR